MMLPEVNINQTTFRTPAAELNSYKNTITPTELNADATLPNYINIADNFSSSSFTSGVVKMSGVTGVLTKDDSDKIRHFIELAKVFKNPQVKDDARLRAAEELNEQFETILTSPHYQLFVTTTVPIFLKFLEDGQIYFVAEHHGQQGRNAILRILHRMPSKDMLRPYCTSILKLMFKLLEIDNEENVVICLRIIIELLKQYRPEFSQEVRDFFDFVKSAYTDLPGNTDKIFCQEPQSKIKDVSEVHVAAFANSIYNVTSCQSENAEDGCSSLYNVLPKGRNSLKVLQELPIIVVLMYQIYKTNVQSGVAQFIPIAMLTITLQPNVQQRQNAYFNEDAFVEFMTVQVKTLSFLAYIVKMYKDLISQKHDLLVNGFINLLRLCPMETAYLRRELFIAARHIMATELRFKFIPYLDKLFDERILLGEGWTVHETMRPLAYSTLADFVHHVREQLTLNDLSRTVMFFSCHLHDESLPLAIQTMSCKLLFNLVEFIVIKSKTEGGNGREILMRLLDVLVYKLKVIVQVYIPFFLESNKEDALSGDKLFAMQSLAEGKAQCTEEVRQFGFPLAPHQSYALPECRTLVKAVFWAIRTISLEISSYNKIETDPVPDIPSFKQLTSGETKIFINLLELGVKVVEIFTIKDSLPNTKEQSTCNAPSQQNRNAQVHPNEAKEVLEQLASCFVALNNYTLREILVVNIDILVESVLKNGVIQVIVNSFLISQSTFSVFAAILFEYLLPKISAIGENVPKSNLYLGLFKLLFNSVNRLPSETEKVFRPHLQTIVNRSMELALVAKDPCNYYLLLIALFNSIKGDLYKEFLAVLPSFFQSLNRLQRGCHKPHAKDIFVELCLTVPVRISNLTQYIPLLMDPLVYALNSSGTLLSHGLRTVELCIDNLHADFLVENIQPVAAELMQALYGILRKSNNAATMSAFRILGKLGGHNRQMLMEPQKLAFVDKPVLGQCITLFFPSNKKAVALPVDKIVESAVEVLSSVNSSLFYKKQAFQVVKTFIMGSLNEEGSSFASNKITLHEKMSEGVIISSLPAQQQSLANEKYRSTLKIAITGIFFGVLEKELKREAYLFMIPFIRHIGLVIASLETGPFAGKVKKIHPYVLFDAMILALCHKEKDMHRPVLVAVSILMNCVINVVQSKDRACSLPMMEYLAEKMFSLCYERAWYTKQGGCHAIQFFLENMPLRWILCHQSAMVRATFFVLTDLTGEMSTGTLDMARENLASVIRICAACDEGELETLKGKSLHVLSLELIQQLPSGSKIARDESTKGLEMLAQHQSKTVLALVEPHKDVLKDVIPPKKGFMSHRPMCLQFGLLDANTFLLDNCPNLFKLDLNIKDHENFLGEIILLCESDAQSLSKLPCYSKSGNADMESIKMAMMRVIARVSFLNEACQMTKERIVNLFVKEIGSGNSDLMQCGFECLQKFMETHPIEIDKQVAAFRPIIILLGDIRKITVPVIMQLKFYYQLFPALYSEKFWITLLQTFQKSLVLATGIHEKVPRKSGIHELNVAIEFLSLFSLPHLPLIAQFVDPVARLCLQAEKSLLLGQGSPLCQPLMKFLLKQPEKYVDLMFSMPFYNSNEWVRFFTKFLQQKDANQLRRCVLMKLEGLKYCLSIKSHPTLANWSSQQGSSQTTYTFTSSEQSDIQYFAVKTMTILSKFNEDWILGASEVFKTLRNLWESDDYQESCNKHICYLPSSRFLSSNDASYIANEDGTTLVAKSNGIASDTEVVAMQRLQSRTWKEPQMIVKLLLSYYRNNTNDIEMLFKLLLAFCDKSISHSQYEFLRQFLKNEVVKYSVEWKRSAFFHFVTVFQDKNYTWDLKAKIIELIIIPCMAHCFENDQGDLLIGSKPTPDKDNSDNIVHVFLNTLIHPDISKEMADSVRILICRMFCLVVKKASAHIIDRNSKQDKQNKLKQLMTFVYPCLLSKTRVDSNTKYYGHLLLCYIIENFQIQKRIILQVFQCLLKASVLEAKNVVKEALDILTPLVPNRMENGHRFLVNWTKKILLEEGHSLSQLMHLLQLIVRQWKVYYPGRQALVGHMVSAIQRLGFSPTSTLEHRRLAVDLAEVIIKWELERIENEGIKVESSSPSAPGRAVSKSKGNADSVVKFLMHMACKVSEGIANQENLGEILSKRCVDLLETIFRGKVWSDCAVNLSWMEIVLSAVISPNSNIPTICKCLEFLIFIIGIVSKEKVLEYLNVVQKGVSSCINSKDSQISSAVNSFITKLMEVFPPLKISKINDRKYQLVNSLYTKINKIIYDGLNNYNLVSGNPQSLLIPLMLLQTACGNNPSYIDKIATPFVKVLAHLEKLHVKPISEDKDPATTALVTKLLVLSLDLIKNRIGVLGIELKKVFIENVLADLIEKSTDAKVIEGIIKMLDNWITNEDPFIKNQSPNLKEKSILLVKLMSNVEKRFPNDQELLNQFFNLINFIYSNVSFDTGDLYLKLEPAFLSGLRSTQPSIRNNFYRLFDLSMKKQVHIRLNYILCKQNWESIGLHYWIKQCVEVLLATVTDSKLVLTPPEAMLPGIAHSMHNADSSKIKAFMQIDPCIDVEPYDYELPHVQQLENLVDDLGSVEESEIEELIQKIENSFIQNGCCHAVHPIVNVKKILVKEKEFVTLISQQKSNTFIHAVSQLIHLDTNLAEKVWIALFPKVWAILSENHKKAIGQDIGPFLCSSAHLVQRNRYPNAINTFVEALCASVVIQPSVLVYLGKTFNLWHRSAFLLEKMILDYEKNLNSNNGADGTDVCLKSKSVGKPDKLSFTKQEYIDALSELYSLLHEEDLWAGLWQANARYPLTNEAIGYEIQGLYEQAEVSYKSVMIAASANFGKRNAPSELFSEMKLWDNHWLRCCKELNQWDVIQDYNSGKLWSCNLIEVLDGSWRVPDWNLAKETLTKFVGPFSEDEAWKANLLQGYVSLSLDKDIAKVKTSIQTSLSMCIKDWRKLPRLISHCHIELLQASQMIVELLEGAQMHIAFNQRVDHADKIKNVVTAWRHRLPLISDNLSHWAHIFTWRQQQYHFIANQFKEAGNQIENQTTLGLHPSAQAICQIGKIARKLNLPSVCFASLSKIYASPSVPIIDVFEKIKQEVKCCIQQAQCSNGNDLNDVLEIMESINVKYFSKEMIGEFFALKGLIFSKLGNSEDAHKSFSAACQLHDDSSKSWGFWGDFLESKFMKDDQQIEEGVSAIIAFMHSCRHIYEFKSRKYIAKILWLLMYDDEKGTLRDKVEKLYSGVPQIHWLPWVPQLLTILVGHNGNMFVNLLNHVGRMYPQAIYFPLRTLYESLKVEQSEKLQQMEKVLKDEGSVLHLKTQITNVRTNIQRCIRVIHLQRQFHPMVLSSLERIGDQVISLNVNWYEEVYCHLKICLRKAYTVAFDNKALGWEAAITPQLLNDVKLLVSKFGQVKEAEPTIENSCTAAKNINESLEQVKLRFSMDFSSLLSGTNSLHNLVEKLRIWIKNMEVKTGIFPRTHLMENRFRYLQNFSPQIAEIDIPGEFLVPKRPNYYVKIDRFQPRVEIVQKHNTYSRRIFVRGNNGKVYPYLAVSNVGSSDGKGEDRVLQFARMLNDYLSQQNATAKRHLRFTVPNAVAISPQVKLIEDNPASLSLLDILKNSCSLRSVENDNLISYFYEKLGALKKTKRVQIPPGVLQDIFMDIQPNVISKGILREWAINTFVGSSDYFLFRKMFALQLGLWSFAEYAFHLTRLDPDIMYIHKDSGAISVSHFKFDINDKTGELGSIRPVPFRLTPNIVEFLSPFGVEGPLMSSIISSARCLDYPNYQIPVILRVILGDEIIYWVKQNEEQGIIPPGTTNSQSAAKVVIETANKCVNDVARRIETLSTFDGSNNEASRLIASAKSSENLCRMDPLWYPWL